MLLRIEYPTLCFCMTATISLTFSTFFRLFSKLFATQSKKVYACLLIATHRRTCIRANLNVLAFALGRKKNSHRALEADDARMSLIFATAAQAPRSERTEFISFFLKRCVYLHCSGVSHSGFSSRRMCHKLL